MAMLFTIGHSNHPLTRFLELLTGSDIAAVADVRSQPVSRWAPQYNKDALMSTLEACGIGYFFMGRELGGRPRQAELMAGGRPDYAKMARVSSFRDAIARLKKDSAKSRIALMCAERDPTDCHRFLLIARSLASQGMQVVHILHGGEIETQTDVEKRLLSTQPQADLFG